MPKAANSAHAPRHPRSRPLERCDLVLQLARDALGHPVAITDSRRLAVRNRRPFESIHEALIVLQKANMLSSQSVICHNP